MGTRGHKLVLALLLLGFDLRGRAWATNYTEPGPALWSGGAGFRLQEAGDEVRDFGLEDLKAAVALADKVPDDAITGPKDAAAIALHRFQSGACDKSAADAVLDFSIALEAVLLQENDELSFRLSLYGARYLGTTTEERAQLFKGLRDVYRLRSDIVHGSAAAFDSERLSSIRDTARNLSARVLLKALREGWPTKEQLRDLALA